MRRIFLFSGLVVFLALLLNGCGAAKDKPKAAEDTSAGAAYHKIGAEEAYEMKASQQVVVVDVRTREEYDGGQYLLCVFRHTAPLQNKNYSYSCFSLYAYLPCCQQLWRTSAKKIDEKA